MYWRSTRLHSPHSRIIHQNLDHPRAYEHACAGSSRALNASPLDLHHHWGRGDATNGSVKEFIYSLNQWFLHCSALKWLRDRSAIGGHIYFIGGHDGVPPSSMERYDPLTNEWVAQPSMNVVWVWP